MQTEATKERLDAMENELNYLAMEWRGLQRQSKEVVERYQTILRQMIALGFRQSLDVDAELPDALMPQEYFEMFNK